MNNSLIDSPNSPQLQALVTTLHENSLRLATADDWPTESLAACGEQGVFRWFLPEEWGGFSWSDADVVRGYLELSAACLTTTFIITQRTGACRRIANSANDALKQRLLPNLAAGATHATVGISHLTTSRQHVKTPVLTATQQKDGGFLLNGFSPWVTGAQAADHLVIGATLEDGRQILTVVDRHAAGVEVKPPTQLVGLSASQTGAVHFHDTRVPADLLLAGPVENVMKSGSGANTGGLETSTLAVGLATAALRYLAEQGQQRDVLTIPTEHLEAELDTLRADLLAADGTPNCGPEQIRTKANSLVLRATQAALTAAKGAGYVEGHPVGRWCREAMFFLVWSCPAPVLSANLCELAGIQT